MSSSTGDGRAVDGELKQLAALALRNAFWRDFSALVNQYLAAAEGLDVYAQEAQMGDMTSVYGRDTDASCANPVAVWAQVGEPTPGVVRFDTLLDALEHDPAEEISLRGKTIFKRRDGEWYGIFDEGEEAP